jgi:hypothetical protein
MTRRLDPLDRIRELSDASVPFNFDVHAMFFSKDAVSIESTMHERLAEQRVNVVNQRREFFRVTPLQAKQQLTALAGELLEFTETPEALEYRQSCQVGNTLRTEDARQQANGCDRTSEVSPPENQRDAFGSSADVASNRAPSVGA